MNRAIEKAIEIVGSQKELARRMGVTQPNISRLLHRQNLRPSTCQALAAAVNGSITAAEFKQGFVSDNPSFNLQTVSYSKSW